MKKLVLVSILACFASDAFAKPAKVATAQPTQITIRGFDRPCIVQASPKFWFDANKLVSLEIRAGVEVVIRYADTSEGINTGLGKQEEFVKNLLEKISKECK